MDLDGVERLVRPSDYVVSCNSLVVGMVIFDSGACGD